jgi:hypothetical protein
VLEVDASEHDLAHPWLPPLTLGAVIMTQARSLTQLTLGMGVAATAGADPAILVSSDVTSGDTEIEDATTKDSVQRIRQTACPAIHAYNDCRDVRAPNRAHT